jgi:DNA polymerase III subunit epsilon
MAQGEAEAPQRSTLLHRAYELLEGMGEPATETQLIQHLFGTSNSAPLWRQILRTTLRSSPLFGESEEAGTESGLLWSLTAWKSTLLTLDEVDFVVVDTETTGLQPRSDRVIEIAAVRVRSGEVRGSFQTLLNPQRSIPPFIVRFTGDGARSSRCAGDFPRVSAIYRGRCSRGT